MKIILAQPRGFCAGVDRAIDIVEEALKIYGPPVYVKHEIVHNKRVVEDLKEKGAIFVEEIKKVPNGAVTVFSAHGVSRKVEEDSKERKLPILDATCPLVLKVHNQGKKYAKKGYEIILIGHEGHPEVEGTQGRIPGGVHLVSTREDVINLKVKNKKKLTFFDFFPPFITCFTAKTRCIPKYFPKKDPKNDLFLEIFQVSWDIISQKIFFSKKKSFWRPFWL